MTPRTSARDWTRSTGGSGVCVCSLADPQIDCLSTRSTLRSATAVAKLGAIAHATATPIVVSGVRSSVRDVPSASITRPERSSSTASVIALVMP